MIDSLNSNEMKNVKLHFLTRTDLYPSIVNSKKKKEKIKDILLPK